MGSGLCSKINSVKLLTRIVENMYRGGFTNEYRRYN